MAAFRAFDPSSAPPEPGYSTTGDAAFDGYAPDYAFLEQAPRESKVGTVPSTASKQASPKVRRKNQAGCALSDAPRHSRLLACPEFRLHDYEPNVTCQCTPAGVTQAWWLNTPQAHTHIQPHAPNPAGLLTHMYTPCRDMLVTCPRSQLHLKGEKCLCFMTHVCLVFASGPVSLRRSLRQVCGCLPGIAHTSPGSWNNSEGSNPFQWAMRRSFDDSSLQSEYGCTL